MNTSNNSRSGGNRADGDTLDDQIRHELNYTADQLPETQRQRYIRIRRVRPPPVFCDLNPVAQLLPQVCEDFVENGLALDTSARRPSIALPEEYFSFNSPETSTLLSILMDPSQTRLIRLLDRVHIRAMLREDRYYQIVDDPSLYFRCKSSDLPAFHNRVVLYLTTPGLLIYLKQTTALNLLVRVRSTGTLRRTNKMIARREKRQPPQRQPQAEFASALAQERRRERQSMPFIEPYAYQFATYVHCYEGDILRFQLDFLAVKRDYQDAVPILLEMGWLPKSPSVLLYRRRYYQYMTPFLDWVDMLRYQLKTMPTISITGFYERLLDHSLGDVDIDDLEYQGRTMLECVELRHLTKANCDEANLLGLYAGRRVYKDKEPRCHRYFRKAFGEQVIRPVLPHACSPMRRFLVHLRYYDRNRMCSLSQVLNLVDYLFRQQFFAMHPVCLGSNIRYEPLVFQVYDFVWSIRQGHVFEKRYLRNEKWEDIKTKEDAYAWYQRWDVYNCICLLLSVCQRAMERDVDETLIDRLVCLLIDVLRSSQFLEAFYSYSYFDTYLGVSSAINAVPNLQLSTLMRVLHTVPFHLTDTLSASEIGDSFSARFWLSPAAGTVDSPYEARTRAVPRTHHEIGEFLMTRPRRCCVRQAPISDSIKAMSGMSALGSTGAVALFCRDYASMRAVEPVEEASVVSNDHLHQTRRAEEERQHLAEYRRADTDYRYGKLFTDAYFMAMGRPRMMYHENLTYQQCRELSMLPYTDSRDV